MAATHRQKMLRFKPSPIITEKPTNLKAYWRQPQETLSTRKLEETIKTSERKCRNFQVNGDISGVESCYMYQGDVYFHFHDILSALHCYKVQRDLNEQTQNYQCKLLAYQQIGCCYRLIKQYQKALVNYKKLLQLAWAENSIEWELKAYDFIGLTYYYFGELEKSKYYHRRMWEGIFEDKKSVVREISMRALNAKRQKRNVTEDRGKMLMLTVMRTKETYSNFSDDEDVELPSPRTGSGENDQKLLPFCSSQAKKVRITRKNSIQKSMTSRIRPFMLVSHLSPIESPKCYFYVEQMSQYRIRDQLKSNLER